MHQHAVSVVVVCCSLWTMMGILSMDLEIRHQFGGACPCVDISVEPVNALLCHLQLTPSLRIENHRWDAVFIGVVVLVMVCFFARGAYPQNPNLVGVFLIGPLHQAVDQIRMLTIGSRPYG